MKWHLSVALSSLVLLAAHTALAASRPYIIENGQPNAQIVIAADAIRPVELAAEQLTFQAPRTGQESGRLADLVAYRGMIESVPDWPFTLSTYARVALYLLLPIVTWGIGLVAEDILGRVFS